MDYVFLIILLIFMVGMLFMSSRKAKKQQQERQDFRASLQPGTEVITIGGIIGKVVSVDTQYEEIVLDTEGTQMRFGFNAIARQYIRPAFVSDDEVDENGNPLPTEPAEIEAESDEVVATDGDDTAVEETVVAAEEEPADEAEKSTEATDADAQEQQNDENK